MKIPHLKLPPPRTRRPQPASPSSPPFYRKLLVFLGLILATSCVSLNYTAQPVYAEDDTSFLGFVPWYNGLSGGTDVFSNINSTDGLANAIWTIVANIATDLTVAGAYLVLGYVIYGGYLYIFSAGDPGKVALGKKAISQALIGLAIVMGANLIVNTIRIALGVQGTLTDCFQITDDKNYRLDSIKDSCDTTTARASRAIQWAIGIAGVVALVFVVIGAFTYITSAGDAGKVQTAKHTILYALVGLAIVALAEILTGFASKTIRNAIQASEQPAESEPPQTSLLISPPPLTLSPTSDNTANLPFATALRPPTLRHSSSYPSQFSLILTLTSKGVS